MKRDKDLQDYPEFQEYRRTMHQSMTNPDRDVVEEDEERRRKPGVIHYAFGIFMIIVYVGMGVLLLTGFFGHPAGTIWTVLNWVVGIILIIYGIWRAVRLIFGLDTRL